VAGEEKTNFQKTATIKKTVSASLSVFGEQLFFSNCNNQPLRNWLERVAQLNPVWNESFEFELGPTPAHCQLTFHVYDWDRLSSGTRTPTHFAHTRFGLC
jgi:hypothetical protein